jgi:hypothetical protein
LDEIRKKNIYVYRREEMETVKKGVWVSLILENVGPVRVLAGTPVLKKA